MISQKIHHGVWLTLSVFLIFEMGDMQHPDGVTGASRRYAPSQPVSTASSAPQVSEPPLVQTSALKLSAPAVTHEEAPAPPDNLLVSIPSADSQPSLPAPPPLSLPSSERVINNQHCRMFGGVVVSVKNRDLDPAVIQKAVISGSYGEEFSFIIIEGTRIYNKDGTPSSRKMLLLREPISVIYALGKENEAVAVKLE